MLFFVDNTTKHALNTEFATKALDIHSYSLELWKKSNTAAGRSEVKKTLVHLVHRHAKFSQRRRTACSVTTNAAAGGKAPKRSQTTHRCQQQGSWQPSSLRGKLFSFLPLLLCTQRAGGRPSGKATREGWRMASNSARKAAKCGRCVGAVPEEVECVGDDSLGGQEWRRAAAAAALTVRCTRSQRHDHGDRKGTRRGAPSSSQPLKQLFSAVTFNYAGLYLPFRPPPRLRHVCFLSPLLY